ncbi:MAG: hypothetical protein EU539_08505 [Promethearchaeota archaeon]|nr:MAG: hypothetical protein EU539_08505 [Candidatus Lokiarchaeota archaeon]
MTEVSEKEFIDKLSDVIGKLASIANTQGSRFMNKWKEYFTSLTQSPHSVRKIRIDKEKFKQDIKYRIELLNNVEACLVDGFYTIKSLLETLYNSYFDSELFKKDFSKKDQLILKYLVAREILGNLVQYNMMDHDSVPTKYNIMARNYLLIKMNGQKDKDILENMKKLKIKNLSLPRIRTIMKEIENEGIISISKKDDTFFYNLKKELKLSPKGKESYNKTLRPLIDWPTQFWRSFYNIRELNVTLDEKTPHRDFLNSILSRSATQGFSAADYVFKNLIKYYEELQEATK